MCVRGGVARLARPPGARPRLLLLLSLPSGPPYVLGKILVVVVVLGMPLDLELITRHVTDLVVVLLMLVGWLVVIQELILIIFGKNLMV